MIISTQGCKHLSFKDSAYRSDMDARSAKQRRRFKVVRSALSVVVAIGCVFAISGCASHYHYRSAYEREAPRTVYQVREVKVVKVKYKKNKGHAYGRGNKWRDD